MTAEKELTGYPSIDKPWLKYYDEEVIAADIPSMGMYEYLMAQIAPYPSDSACLNYFGNRISYQTLIESIEKVAKSFIGLGVREGDIVSIVSPTTPEAIYCIYGLNRIGAIANIIDPRLSSENLEEKIASSVAVIGIDLIGEKLRDCCCGLSCFTFSVSQSFPYVKRMVYKLLKKTLRLAKLGTWDEFLEQSSKIGSFGITACRGDDTAIIVSTSGTTGKSKLAMLTNANVNAVAWQYARSGILHNQGDIFLNVMPVFLSYGIAAGMRMPLCLGFESVIIPSRDMEKVGAYLLKYKPQSYLDIPTSFDELLRSRDIKETTDLSFLRNPGVGGDHLNPRLEERVNEFLRVHGCRSSIQKGYGLTEMSSAAIVNVSDSCNTLGSVGIPLPKTDAKIVDVDTREELPIGEIGELCLSGPALFKGYFGDCQATRVELEVDENGKAWVKTGDLFSMNENGELFFHERLKMMFVRPDGHNNHPNMMSEAIRSHPVVKDVCTVGVPSPFHSQGSFPKAVIVLTSEGMACQKRIQGELEKTLLAKFSRRDIPYFYEFRDELPHTPNGKVDFKKLESEGVENASPSEICKEELYSEDSKGELAD